MASNYEAIRKAALRGHPLAQRAVEAIEAEAAAFGARLRANALIGPEKGLVVDVLAGAMVDANPYLRRALDGRTTRYRQRYVKAA